MNMTPRFYFNIGENMCASENWLVEYLQGEYPSPILSEEEILYELHTRREFHGWFECEISNDIFEAFC